VIDSTLQPKIGRHRMSTDRPIADVPSDLDRMCSCHAAGSASGQPGQSGNLAGIGQPNQSVQKQPSGPDTAANTSDGASTRP
jgi:hypothetical protein